MGAVEKVQPRVSFADLERAPEDGRRYELYDGEVYVVPAPIPLHQVVQHTLTELLRRVTAAAWWVRGLRLRSTSCSPTTTSSSPTSSSLGPRGPTWSTSHRAIRHAPDLCVEILSPSTEATDRGRKMQMFARYGVPEYWIVDPVNETIEVHRLRLAATCSCSARRVTTR